MDDDDAAARLHQFAPNPADLQKRIRELAQDSKNVGFFDHADDRMDERGISDLDALRVLRNGDIAGPITAGAYPGEWKCKVVGVVKGRREIGVVVLTIRNRKLRVKTVEWEDLR
jgi:hypothetical protein